MDNEYLQILLEPLKATEGYLPKLGHGGKQVVSPEVFQEIYQQDVFYRWIGLNMPEIYIAHRAAGGITSLYRQLGIGCEQLLRRILKDTLELAERDLDWDYRVSEGERNFKVSLDACILINKVSKPEPRARLTDWIDAQREANSITAALEGVVFEVRQGYKSKDSKRQAADLRSASRAYQASLLPCMMLFSQQIDPAVEARYKSGGWILLKGDLSGSSLTSTYAFLREVVGFDLANFLERHQDTIRKRVQEVVRSLLVLEGE